jgi:hypothetical protein
VLAIHHKNEVKWNHAISYFLPHDLSALLIAHFDWGFDMITQMRAREELGPYVFVRDDLDHGLDLA